MRKGFLKNLRNSVFATLIISSVSLASGLDVIHDIVAKDKRLQRKVSQEDIQEALNCANRMNEIILEAIIETGAGNDNKITTPEVREMNKYIVEHYNEEWKVLHGDDEENTETGFHKIVNNGAKIKIFGRNAVNKVFDGIYHLGYTTEDRRRLLNEDGNRNVKFDSVASWLTRLLKKDLANGDLRNPSITEVKGETGKKLDRAVDILYKDKNVNKLASIGDIRKAARAANEMNKIIVEAAEATGALDDGKISRDEVMTINKYIVENYGDIWPSLYQDFKSIMYARPKTRILKRNAIRRVFREVYYIGFKSEYSNRLTTDEGGRGPNTKRISYFLDKLLKDK
jgi:hypothetical protein